MRIDIITIFPKMFAPVLNESIIKRAQAKKKLEIHLHDLRDYTRDKHRKVDDRPFGGGSGMLMRPEPIFEAVEKILGYRSLSRTLLCRKEGKNRKPSTKVILLCPQGEKLTQGLAKRMARYKHLILICGHYEGVDERVKKYLVDQEISIGDYILTGGELPAMVLMDALTRLIPGVLGDKNSLNFESFEGNLLEYPHYTRPAKFKGMAVPGVLLCGDHAKIEDWRRKEALKKTKVRRPDLLSK
jgi:tRNA (guanine37-N1)-methyltransferase